MEKKWIIYRGTNRIRKDEVFRGHGMEFKKGYIYPVSPEVYEYLKSTRGFEKCFGVGSKEVIDFPKPKEEVVTKSYEKTYGPKHGEKK